MLKSKVNKITHVNFGLNLGHIVYSLTGKVMFQETSASCISNFIICIDE